MVPPRGRPDRLRLYFGVRPALLGSAGFWNGWGRVGRAALTLQDFVPQSGRSPPWGGRNGHGARKPEPWGETSAGARPAGAGPRRPPRESVAARRRLASDDSASP